MSKDEKVGRVHKTKYQVQAIETEERKRTLWSIDKHGCGGVFGGGVTFGGRSETQKEPWLPHGGGES